MLQCTRGRLVRGQWCVYDPMPSGCLAVQWMMHGTRKVHEEEGGGGGKRCREISFAEKSVLRRNECYGEMGNKLCAIVPIFDELKDHNRGRTEQYAAAPVPGGV